ncbi:MAG: low molecular weight phosphotyrosine protein phosphatase [Gammaproteobacteria bacterium]|nr:low molecular weight phosphotyrosine protein phosphatase [Gammaproteobacteria bacterium]
MAVKVLFVCMGNICRSPTAEGVFRALVEREGCTQHIEIDSAGTHAYHVGEPPDPRSQQAAAMRGIDMSMLRGRKVLSDDIERFDYILAMDRENYENLLSICPEGLEQKIELFMSYASERQEEEVPDPYFGGMGGFDRVLDMIEDASSGLLQDIFKRHGLR